VALQPRDDGFCAAATGTENSSSSNGTQEWLSRRHLPSHMHLRMNGASRSEWERWWDGGIRKNLGMRAAIRKNINRRWNELTANTQDATADSSTETQFNYRYHCRRLHADM